MPRVQFKTLSSRPLTIALILTLVSCSTGSKLPSDVAELKEPSRDIETIAIVGTNDIHGALGPLELKTRETDGTPSVNYKAAGMPALASYINELRTEFGSSLLWLDGGDEFQGSIESNMAQGEPIVAALNQMGLNAAAVGNHEFDYGPSKNGLNKNETDTSDRLGALKARMAQAQYPYLSANIRDKATGALATDQLPHLKPHKIFDTGRVKVGVFGLTTLETPRSTTGLNIRNLTFADLKETAIQESEYLRKQGADLVVLVSHVGLKCERGRAPMASHIRSPLEPLGECNPRDEMVKLLKAIPAGTIDAVVAGHSHQVVHHWVENVPVIEGGAFGRYLNVIYLNYDVREKKLLTDLTRIEGPVPVCTSVFQNQNDCNGERPAPRGGRGSLVAAQFHNTRMRENSAIESLIEPVLERSADVKKEVVAKAARPIEHERFKESEIGNLIADAMRHATSANAALMNTGGIRAPWDQGDITFDNVFRSMPFDNQVVALKLKGHELKLLLRIAESGSRGFFSVSGVRLKLIPLEEEAKGTDLNGDGRIEPWEVNRLISVELDDGSPIEDNKEYRLATIDFLINGGDDLGWFMGKLSLDRQEPPIGLVRDILIQRMKVLSQSGPLNSVDHPILDPVNPRMKFEKTKAKGRSKGKRRGRGRRH